MHALEHFGHFALDDLARETFGDGGLADAGIADEERIVLVPAAKDLDRALDFRLTSDERIDAALARLVVEIDAIGFERVGALLDDLLGILFLLVGAAHRLGLAHARALGDAVTHVIHGIEPRHVLFLEEIDGMAFALREERDEHIGACHLVPAGILHMQHGALHDTLETGRGLGVLAVLDRECREILVDIFGERGAQGVEIDIARAHHLRGVRVVDEREQQVLERGVFVMALTGEPYGPVQSLL